MKLLDYIGRAISVLTPIGQRIGSRLYVTTRCVDCGASHVMFLVPGKISVGLMRHRPECFLDMRNLRRSMTEVRRC